MAFHNEVGRKGEEIASHFLRSNNFLILKTNIRFGKKEIDILSEKDNIVRVVEVKTVEEGSPVSAEDNFTIDKVKNLKAVLRLLAQSDEFHGKHLQIDFLSVSLNFKTRIAKCKLVENVDTDSFE